VVEPEELELEEELGEELESAVEGCCCLARELDCAEAWRNKAAIATTERGIRKKLKGRDENRDDTLGVRLSPKSLREPEMEAQAIDEAAGYQPLTETPEKVRTA
jgi:hypothetical protein